MAFLCQASCHVVSSRGLAYTSLSVHYRYYPHRLFYNIIVYILSDSDIPDSLLSDYVLSESDISDSDITYSDFSDSDLFHGKVAILTLRVIS